MTLVFFSFLKLDFGGFWKRKQPIPTESTKLSKVDPQSNTTIEALDPHAESHSGYPFGKLRLATGAPTIKEGSLRYDLRPYKLAVTIFPYWAVVCWPRLHAFLMLLVWIRGLVLTELLLLLRRLVLTLDMAVGLCRLADALRDVGY